MAPITRLGRLAACLSAPLLLLCCAGGERPAGGPGEAGSGRLLGREPRDVVLITVDTLRHDATGFSGAGKAETPAMDRLASSGLVFRSAYAHAVVTLPSHASMLTGLYPYQHGIRDNAGFTLPEEIPTLAGLLQRAGYATGAFISAFPLDRRFGLDSGFQVYDDAYEGHGASAFGFPERPGGETVSRAREWWDSRGGQRRFLWVHLFTPHYPYQPPEPFATRYRAEPYYGDVALADAQLSSLLDGLLQESAAPSPVVVLTSDHGEALGAHGESTHGVFAYEETLKVPLVIRAPGLVRAGVSDRLARHVDLLPSLLDLLGLETPPGLAGRSLWSPEEAVGEGSYFEALTSYLNRGWAPLFGRIEDGKKAIRLPIEELYDLEADPAETRNLAPGSPEVLARILSRLPEGIDEPIQRETLDREVVRKLESLGYVASSAPGSDTVEQDESRDPKNLIHLDRALYEALAEYSAGRTEAAIRALENLIERHPDMAVTYAHLSYIHADLGRPERAVETLSRAVSAGVAGETIRRMLALNLVRLGRPEQAWEVLAGDEASRDPETQSALGRIAAAMGRPDAARSFIEKALELDPSFPEALVDLATVLMTEERADEARSHLERALQQNPFIAEGWNLMGVIRSRSGDLAGAIAAWEKAVEVDPRLSDALFNLALALGGTGRYPQAVEALERYLPLVQGEERRRAEDLLLELRRRTTGLP